MLALSYSSPPLPHPSALPRSLSFSLSLFIFLTQMAVIAQRMCQGSLLCNSNLLFRLPLCTKEENMYWLNGLVMDVPVAKGKVGLVHRHGPFQITALFITYSRIQLISSSTFLSFLFFSFFSHWVKNPEV